MSALAARGVAPLRKAVQAPLRQQVRRFGGHGDVTDVRPHTFFSRSIPTADSSALGAANMPAEAGKCGFGAAGRSGFCAEPDRGYVPAFSAELGADRLSERFASTGKQRRAAKSGERTDLFGPFLGGRGRGAGEGRGCCCPRRRPSAARYQSSLPRERWLLTLPLCLSQPLHGPHMYSFPFRAASPTKFGVGIGAYVGIGLYLPWFAFGFSQRKAGTPGW